MATFNLTINYPTLAGPRIMDALKAKVSQDDPENKAPSNAEAIEWLRMSVTRALKDVVTKHERDTAVKVAIDNVAEVEIT